MTPLDYVPQIWRYRLLVLVSSVVSLAGVLLAVYWKSPPDGGRGGAVATAISFLALYLRPDYGLLFYQARKASATSKLPADEQFHAKVNAMEAALAMNSEGQTSQNRALAAAAVIGTLFWGFGDTFAAQILHWMR
jgi:hypothetical protein